MFMNNYAARMEKIWDWMEEEKISLLMLEDNESRRDQNIFWLTGHPSDALLFLSADRKALLAAWDINLANIYASRSPAILTAYDEFERQPLKAILAAAKKFGIPQGSRIEIPHVTPYPVFLEFVGELADYDIVCTEAGSAAMINNLRAVKDEEEIDIMRKTADFTNELIDLLEKKIISGKIKTEADAVMLIQLEARRMGCEGTSFETLAAGPNRSYAIHAFPSWTNSLFGGQGLSILDFGLKYNGYCTDVTITAARDLNPKQEKIVNLVEKASKLAISMAEKDLYARDISAAVDALFEKSKKKMPHNLGHGIGLEPHEYPLIKNRADNEWLLKPGMIFTIEPGLYDQLLGGCRLENDILITETGNEVLTSSRIIRLG